VCVPVANMIHFERTSKRSVFISCAITPGQSVCVCVIMLCLTESARTCLWEEIFYIPALSSAYKEYKHTSPALKDNLRHEQKEALSFNVIKEKRDFNIRQMSSCTYFQPSGKGSNHHDKWRKRFMQLSESIDI